ncbi:hypothetical protein HGRIS_014369 [Hohenbuehelia grisea]|uniref:Tic20 family protein Ycf60 n=1 Tax=Hohenbuehelia grisea TaxID=104357 RepID=A0ABR3JTA5_9AGAR
MALSLAQLINEIRSTYLLGGIIFASPLYGIAVSQAVFYYRHFRKDSLYLKVTVREFGLLTVITAQALVQVAFLVILETVWTFIFISAIYHAAFIKIFGRATVNVPIALVVRPQLFSMKDIIPIVTLRIG